MNSPRHVRLKLFITGNTPRGEQAIRNLRSLCESDPGCQYEVVIIDVLERPQLAEDEKVLATPTLIKNLPPPMLRIVGDLSDTEKVLVGLEITSFQDSGIKKETHGLVKE